MKVLLFSLLSFSMYGRGVVIMHGYITWIELKRVFVSYKGSTVREERFRAVLNIYNNQIKQK